MPESRQSRYQMGTWTVTKLKDELRNRNLSSIGKKDELIARLEQDNTQDPPSASIAGADSPAKMNVNQLKEELKVLGMSPVGNKTTLVQRLQEAQATSNPFTSGSNERKASVKEVTLSKMSPIRKIRGEGMAAEDIGFMTSPITTTILALKCAMNLGKGGFRTIWDYPLILASFVAFSAFLTTLFMFEGPQQVYLAPFRDSVMWYGRWIILGILSSVGLGTGAHTFLLFLGPFIARVTTAAYICKSLDFPLFGPESLLCPTEPYEKFPVTMLMIINKLKWEAFAWGLGTAIGELPPFLVARASALTGRASGEMRTVERILNKKEKRTILETLQLASYHTVAHLGFLGILLCASIPNPLFDLTGITCGYYMIPFTTFALATFLGKAVFKSGIQTSFVVFLFSRDYLEQAISFVKGKAPAWSGAFHDWLLAQRTVFQERRPNPTMDKIGSGWHVFLALTMSYFILSAIRSAAIMQAKREGLIKST